MTAKKKSAKKKKLWQFIGELDSHGIYLLDELVRDMEATTDTKLTSPMLGTMVDKRYLKDVRDSGGYMNEAKYLGRHVTTGYSFALAMCNRLDVKYESYLGRGSQFRSCVEALKEAGK